MRTEAATVTVCITEALGLASTRVRGAKPNTYIMQGTPDGGKTRAPQNPSSHRRLSRRRNRPRNPAWRGCKNRLKGVRSALHKTLHTVTAVVIRYVSVCAVTRYERVGIRIYVRARARVCVCKSSVRMHVIYV